MKTKKLLATVLTLTMIITLLSAFTLTTFAADGDISLSVSIPTGGTAEITLPGTAIFADLKSEMEKVFKISFADEGFGVYCPDAKIRYDHEQPEDTKTLAELGFQSGYKVYAEKTLWTATEENPIKIFGITITGGTGSCEPYGDYSTADYYWNYYYKTLTVNAAKASNVIFSGNADAGAYFIMKSTAYATFDNLTMSRDSGPCMIINSNAKTYLFLKGNNMLTTTGGDESAIMINNSTSISKGKLYIYDYSAYKTTAGYGGGTLTANSTIDGVPAIMSDTTTGGVILSYSGVLTANGGKGAPGIKVTSLTVNSGTLTSNGGEESTEGINVFGTASGSLNISGGVIKTSVIKPNQTDSYVSTVVINEGSDIDEIIDSNVYCNVNNNTKVTDGTKYYKINNRIDSAKASIEFLAGTTTYLKQAYAKAGDVVTLAVTPADGYEISDVKVNGNIIDEIYGDYEFTMPDGLAEITVDFKTDSGEVYEWSIEYDGTNHQAIVVAEEAGEYTVIFADYENGRLNDIDCVPFTLNLGENTVPQIDTGITLSKEDKVMIWNSMTELVPACEALVIQ